MLRHMPTFHPDTGPSVADRPAAAAAIDLDRYPIDRPGAERESLLGQVRQELDTVGCAVLRGFVRPAVLAALVAECEAVRGRAHRNFNETNVYFTADHPAYPPSHPLRRFYARSNAFIPADSFGTDSLIRALYEWEPFAPFIKACLRETHFHRYGDPLADVIVNMAESGPGFPWHFDTNNYTVTLAIQNAEAGGEFEYSPMLRSATDEHYGAVQRVLDGERTTVRTLVLQPGDLQIFRGRYSLHRVAPLQGSRPRYVAIYSYAERPDMVGSPERTRQLYGRVLPIHLERAGRRNDGLVD